MSLLSPEQLLLIHQRAEKATHGPWATSEGEFVLIEYPDMEEDWHVATVIDRTDGDGIYNLDFIAHAREDIPALLDHIQTLERLLADADDTSEGFRRGYLEGQKASLARFTAILNDGPEMEVDAQYRGIHTFAKLMAAIQPVPYEDGRDG